MMIAIIGGGVWAGEKSKIDFSKAAVVMPFESSVTDASASQLPETTQKNVIDYLKKAALFSEGLTPEEANDRDKATLIEITGKLEAMTNKGILPGPPYAEFDIALKDAATGDVLWKKRIKAEDSSSALLASQSRYVAREFVRQLCTLAKKATAKEYSPFRFYISQIGMIIPGKLVGKDLSGASGTVGTAMGGEYWLSQHLTLGGEIDMLYSISDNKHWLPSNGELSAASLSIGTSYHFRYRLDQKLDPFLSAGASVLGNSEAAGTFGQIFLGGGINFWIRGKGGLRLEFRDHALAFGNFMPRLTPLHFMSAQAGICFRF
jgi:hypothetical protein